MFDRWQLQEAKNKFSQIIKQAQQGKPQYVTVRGKPAVVILAVEDYQRLNQQQTKLSKALLFPLLDEEIDLSRDRDTGREIDLFARS
jgi:prevent-host-death family protein